MAEDAPTQDQVENAQHSEELPAKLRVHSLARVLGTTSKRIVDALAELEREEPQHHHGSSYPAVAQPIDEDDVLRALVENDLPS